MSRDEERQKVKEQAILIGVQKGLALFRRNLEIYGMRADGTTELICKSDDYDKLWDDTLKTIQAK